MTAASSEQEAPFLGGALLSGESLLIEVDVPLVVMQRALEKLNPGTHLMFDFAKLNSCTMPQEYQAVAVHYSKAFSWVPAGVNLHVCKKKTYYQWEELFIQRVHSACPLIFGGVLNFDKLKFEKKYANSAYLPIIPEHSQETAIAIAQHALLNQVPICFEEGVTEKTIMAVCDVTAGLSIMLPLPIGVIKDPIASLTDSGKSPKTLVPHPSMSVWEIKNVVKGIYGYSFMLKMDPAMYPEATIAEITDSMTHSRILLLQTEDTALITRVAQNITKYGALKIQPANAQTMAAAASHLGYYGGLYFDASNQAYINTAATNLSKTGMLVLDKSVSESAIRDAVRNLHSGGLIYLVKVSDDFFITMAKELPENCRIEASDSGLWRGEWAPLIEEMQKNTVLSFYKDGRDNSEELQELITLATRHSVKIEFDFDLAKEMLSENPALMGWYTLDPTSGELVCYKGQAMPHLGFEGLPKPPVAAEPEEVAP